MEERRTFLCYGDLAFAEADTGGYALEQALCKADFFHKKALALYRGVRIDALRPVRPEAREAKAEQRQYALPYLLCRGKQPLLIFRIGEEPATEDTPPYPSGIPSLTLYQCGQAQVDALGETVDRILRQERQSPWRCSVTPVPARFWPQVMRLGLMERSLPGGRERWRVSEAGLEHGLSWGWYLDGGRLREGPCWSESARQSLEPLWSAPPGVSKSLASRLQGLDPGWYMQQKVLRFAQTPLGSYMAHFPKELEWVERELGVGPDDPLHQAAALVYMLLQATDEDTRQDAIDLMGFLSLPMIK